MHRESFFDIIFDIFGLYLYILYIYIYIYINIYIYMYICMIDR